MLSLRRIWASCLQTALGLLFQLLLHHPVLLKENEVRGASPLSALEDVKSKA